MDADLGWHRCPQCLGQLEPIDHGDQLVLTCPLCGHQGERITLGKVDRPTDPDVPSFDGF